MCAASGGPGAAEPPGSGPELRAGLPGGPGGPPGGGAGAEAGRPAPVCPGPGRGGAEFGVPADAGPAAAGARAAGGVYRGPHRGRPRGAVHQVHRRRAGPSYEQRGVRPGGPAPGGGHRLPVQFPYPGQESLYGPDGGLSGGSPGTGGAPPDIHLPGPGTAPPAGPPRLQPSHLQYHGSLGPGAVTTLPPVGGGGGGTAQRDPV